MKNRLRRARCLHALIADRNSKLTLFCWRKVSLSTSPQALTANVTQCVTTTQAVQVTAISNALAFELRSVTSLYGDNHLDTTSVSGINVNSWTTWTKDRKNRRGRSNSFLRNLIFTTRSSCHGIIVVQRPWKSCLWSRNCKASVSSNRAGSPKNSSIRAPSAARLARVTSLPAPSCRTLNLLHPKTSVASY